MPELVLESMFEGADNLEYC